MVGIHAVEADTGLLFGSIWSGTVDEAYSMSLDSLDGSDTSRNHRRLIVIAMAESNKKDEGKAVLSSCKKWYDRNSTYDK